MSQPIAAKGNSLLKKIIFAILIAIAVIVVLFIALVVYISLRPTSVAPSVYSDTANYDLSSGASFAEAPAADSASRYQASAPAAPETADKAPIDQKVIKTASMDIVVEDIDQTVNKITSEASALSGFIQNSSVRETSTGQKYASIILRVPVKNFESLIATIKTFASLVERENINGREVTQEYVDLQSALTHDQAVEAQYLELLKRAQKVEEIIAVREKLDQVQAEIENLKGRLRYLDNQTEMSTISVNISSQVKITLPAEKWQPLEILKGSVSKLIISLQNFVNFFIALIFVLISLIPYIILLGLIFFIVRRIYRKYKKPKK